MRSSAELEADIARLDATRSNLLRDYYEALRAESGSERPPDHVSVQEAADLFKVCEGTIRNWVRSGQVESFKGPHRGSRVRIPYREVLRLKGGVS